jgi:acetolactate synthase-1/3 small subunit
MTKERTIQRHTFSVLTDNEPGVAARIIGLFSGRGYNIDSLTVAEVDPEKNLSRFTIVTSGTEMVLEQIRHQLQRLVSTRAVNDLTAEGPHLERELALIKVSGRGENRIEALRLADVFRARVVDSSTESFVFEVTGSSDKVNAFVNLMRGLGLVEIARTGVAAMSRGPKGMA